MERDRDPIGDENWVQNAYARGVASVLVDHGRDSSFSLALQQLAGLAAIEAADQLRARTLISTVHDRLSTLGGRTARSVLRTFGAAESVFAATVAAISPTKNMPRMDER